MKGKVLVVEDDALVREALCQTLELADIDCIQAGSFIVAKDHIARKFDGIVLSDIRMPGRDGLYLLDHSLTVDPELPVILLSGEGDIPMAVGAINKGAFDFLEKPCANEVLLEAVRKAMRARALVLENRRLKSELARGDVAAQMIFGISKEAEGLREQVRRLARVDNAVTIFGLPGTGIAKVAEVLHRLSPRASQDFSRVSGADLSASDLTTLIAENPQGTVFIEEFTAMSGAAQFALLEHLDGAGGARILAGTTRAYQDGFAAGDVLPDLLFRLDALRVRVPALKERPEDIPVIFRQYVRQAAEQANAAEPEVSEDIIAALVSRDWPGNTRELMNAAVRFVLGLEALSEGGPVGLAEKVAQFERTLIVDALVRNQGNASAAAQALLLPRKTFYDKLGKHGIKPDDYR